MTRYQIAKRARQNLIKQAREQAETQWGGKKPIPEQFQSYVRKLFNFVGDLHTESILKNMEEIDKLFPKPYTPQHGIVKPKP